MTTITITEGLAELKTINKRIQKKEQYIQQYLIRQEKLKDPLEKDGGSHEVIRRERQALDDLRERTVKLRTAIRGASEMNKIAVCGINRSIADWLTWRREVAQGAGQFLDLLRGTIATVRKQAAEKQLQVRQATETGAEPDDVIINISESGLAGEIEKHEEILGTLDGQLSLKDATTFITVED